jgi:hypothetical protein
MKRICLPFLAFNFIISALNAQVGVGSKIGVANERFKFDNAPESDLGLYLSYGIFYEYQINKNYFIQPEVFCSERLLKTSYRDNTSRYKDQSFTIDYLTLSIILGTKIQTNNDRIFILGFAGPFLGIGIDGLYQFSERVPDHDSSYYYTNGKMKFGNDEKTDHYKRTDSGLRLGCGIEFYNFHLTISYDWGLSNLFPDNDQKRYSQVFALSFSYRFNFKK